MSLPEKILIGRRDVIDLPDLGIKNIKAKIDTGAYTSSMHTTDALVIEGSPPRLKFKIIGNEGEEKEIETTEFSERHIKNSFGQIEKRFVVKTNVLIFNKTFQTEFSLSDRSGMKHPILLGRKFLKGHFLVDVSKFNLSYKKKRRKERKNIA
jgi:hypothetical protein